MRTLQLAIEDNNVYLVESSPTSQETLAGAQLEIGARWRGVKLKSLLLSLQCFGDWRYETFLSLPIQHAIKDLTFRTLQNSCICELFNLLDD